MSIIGTGIAAGVANSGQAARTQTATSSGQDAQRADHAQQTDKLTITQLHGAGATRDADQDMPDQQGLGYEQLFGGDDQRETPEEEDPNPNDRIHDADAPDSSPANTMLPPTYGPDGEDLPLLHVLDVKA